MGNSVIRDANRNDILQVGPACMCHPAQCCPCCMDQTIPVTRNGTEVASFTRKQLTCCELLQKTNRFSVDFRDIKDPNQRPLIWAAATLFDLQYWEIKQNN